MFSFQSTCGRREGEILLFGADALSSKKQKKETKVSTSPQYQYQKYTQYENNTFQYSLCFYANNVLRTC